MSRTPTRRPSSVDPSWCSGRPRRPPRRTTLPTACPMGSSDPQECAGRRRRGRPPIRSAPQPSRRARAACARKLRAAPRSLPPQFAPSDPRTHAMAVDRRVPSPQIRCEPARKGSARLPPGRRATRLSPRGDASSGSPFCDHDRLAAARRRRVGRSRVMAAMGHFEVHGEGADLASIRGFRVVLMDSAERRELSWADEELELLDVLEGRTDLWSSLERAASWHVQNPSGRFDVQAPWSAAGSEYAGSAYFSYEELAADAERCWPDAIPGSTPADPAVFGLLAERIDRCDAVPATPVPRIVATDRSGRVIARRVARSWNQDRIDAFGFIVRVTDAVEVRPAAEAIWSRATRRPRPHTVRSFRSGRFRRTLARSGRSPPTGSRRCRRCSFLPAGAAGRVGDLRPRSRRDRHPAPGWLGRLPDQRRGSHGHRSVPQRVLGSRRARGAGGGASRSVRIPRWCRGLARHRRDVHQVGDRRRRDGAGRATTPVEVLPPTALRRGAGLAQRSQVVEGDPQLSVERVDFGQPWVRWDFD